MAYDTRTLQDAVALTTLAVENGHDEQNSLADDLLEERDHKELLAASVQITRWLCYALARLNMLDANPEMTTQEVTAMSQPELRPEALRVLQAVGSSLARHLEEGDAVE